MMKNIVKLIKNLKKNPVDKKLLGRWSIDNDEKAFKKADYSNEDNCGVCSEMRNNYLEKSINNSKNNNTLKIKSNEFIPIYYETPYII